LVELCIHIANLFYLASFLVRDMLWLRLLTCCGMILGIVFFTCQPAPLYGPTAWHVVFLAINVIQIRRLVLDRRRLKLTEEQERVAEAAFRDRSRDELLTLLTRVMGEKPRSLKDLHVLCRQELSGDERILRDLAFSHLSRNELLNLLTRRLWGLLQRLNPTRWRRQPTPGLIPRAPAELAVAQGPAA
jgi:hypothetical protein